MSSLSNCCILWVTSSNCVSYFCVVDAIVCAVCWAYNAICEMPRAFCCVFTAICAASCIPFWVSYACTLIEDAVAWTICCACDATGIASSALFCASCTSAPITCDTCAVVFCCSSFKRVACNRAHSLAAFTSFLWSSPTSGSSLRVLISSQVGSRPKASIAVSL